MKKVISFSLWGDNPIYTIGAIKNAELAKEIYPDWTCRYYIGKSTPLEIVNKLIDFDGRLQHTGTSCTDSAYRMVINFVYS